MCGRLVIGLIVEAIQVDIDAYFASEVQSYCFFAEYANFFAV